MRIAVIEVGHWHAHTCIKSLCEAGETICAISDHDSDIAGRRASEIGCTAYTSYAELLDKEHPEFVFAYGIHSEMTEIANALVGRGVPFEMEKPMGTDWGELKVVADEARKRQVFAAVSLPYRRSRLVRRLIELRDSGELGTITACHHRLFGGEPDRYRRWHVPWVLDPEQAGGGPLFNFGPHVVDVFLYLVNEPVKSVFCRTSRRLHELKIEDLATISVLSESGSIGTMEVGYVCPCEQNEHVLSICTDRLFVELTDLQTGVIRWRDGREEALRRSREQASPNEFADTLVRFRASRPPAATIYDMVAALRIINAAVESAQTQEQVTIER